MQAVQGMPWAGEAMPLKGPAERFLPPRHCTDWFFALAVPPPEEQTRKVAEIESGRAE